MKTFFSNTISRFNFRRLISLKIIIPVVSVILVVGPILITRAVVINSYCSKSMEEKVVNIRSQCNMLSSIMSANRYITQQNDPDVAARIEQMMFTYSARILIIDRDFTVIRDTYKEDYGKTIVNKNVISAFKGKSFTGTNKKTGYIDIAIPVYAMNASGVEGVIYVTLQDKNMLEVREYLNDIFANITLVGFLISLLFGVGSVFFTIIPLKKLTVSINRINEGNKGMHIEGRKLIELNRVSQAVNESLDKIRTMDEAKEEFVSNVSHELKTPMTSMKVLAESLMAQDCAPVEMYREFMVDIINEIDRENKIINDLLELVKVDRAESLLNISTVNVNEMVELVLKRLGPIATNKNVELIFESFRSVVAEIDEVKLGLAINNLVENAIKYNTENGWVRVSVNADHRYFYIKVADSGIGIPANCLEQIFDRFYRVDKARSRETGGTGLGLSITKSAIMMHKGTIKVYSKENEGSTFSVRIPLHYSTAGGEA